MSWDVAIPAGVALIQGVLTWYSVHVSVKKHRIRNAVVIGLLGFAGIFLTVVGAVRSSREINALVERNATISKQLTGGDSFCYVDVTVDKKALTIATHGEYPVTSAHLALSGDPDMVPMREVQYPSPLAPHTSQFLFAHDLSDAPSHDFTIGFTALNGSWVETLQTRKIAGQIFTALRIINVKMNPLNADRIKNVELRETWCRVDVGYPLVSGLVEWHEHMKDGDGKPVTLPSNPCPRN